MKTCKHGIPLVGECPLCIKEEKEHIRISYASEGSGARNEPSGYSEKNSPWESSRFD